MIRCLHCGAETSNGLALCGLCRHAASEYLTYLAFHFRNLSRWRPGRSGTSRPVPGSRVLYDGSPARVGTGDRISDTLDETANALTTWARAAADDRPHLARLLDRLISARAAETITEAEVVAWLCVGADRYLTSIATLDWCGEFVRDLARHEEKLRVFTERYVPGWYAGRCRQPIGFNDEGAAVRCDTKTHVVPGLTWVTCGGCGATTHATDHLEYILEEARGWVARPKLLAEAVVALVHTEASVPRLYDRIRQWEQRDRLTPIQRMARGYTYDAEADRLVVVDERVGVKRYRLGDVLDLVLAEARRTNVVDNSARAS